MDNAKELFSMVDNFPPETLIQISQEYLSCSSHMEILFIHKICTAFYPSFLPYPQPPEFAFFRLFPYNVCIDFNDFRSKIMNQYEKEIQALKYRCRKLEQQCSMFDDTFQKQNHLLFLHDFRVPATNNEAERLLRNYKLKQAQARKPMALTVISLHHRFSQVQLALEQ